MRKSLLCIGFLTACSTSYPSGTRDLAVSMQVTTVFSFSGPDGAYPRASMLAGDDGRLYGTTWKGGGYGGGNVFVFDPNTGVETPLHGFSPLDSSGRNYDGFGPNSPVSFGPDGRLYGTAREGGEGGNPIRPAVGTIFSLEEDGSNFTKLHDFGSMTGYSDGVNPMGGINFDGEIGYGVTKWGNVYKLSEGSVSRIYQMNSSGDGENPYGSPTIGPDGKLYGMTIYGGTEGHGVVYRVDPSTGEEQILYDFTHPICSCNSDNAPLQSPALVSDGSLFGTDEFGGENGTGVIYRITDGFVTIVHEFGEYSSQTVPRFANNDGSLPISTPVEGPDGMIYGTTYYGGQTGRGTIWRIQKDGSGFESLFSFSSDGMYPGAGLTVAQDGSLYGTTFLGGANGYGTIFHVVFQ